MQNWLYKYVPLSLAVIIKPSIKIWGYATTTKVLIEPSQFSSVQSLQSKIITLEFVRQLMAPSQYVKSETGDVLHSSQLLLSENAFSFIPQTPLILQTASIKIPAAIFNCLGSFSKTLHTEIRANQPKNKLITLQVVKWFSVSEQRSAAILGRMHNAGSVLLDAAYIYTLCHKSHRVHR